MKYTIKTKKTFHQQLESEFIIVGWVFVAVFALLLLAKIA